MLLSLDQRDSAVGIFCIVDRDPKARLAKDFNIPDGYAFHGQTVHFPGRSKWQRSHSLRR